MSTEQFPKPIVVRGTEILPSESPQRLREKIARIVLDSMSQFVWLLDVQGTVVEMNQAALDAAGVPLSEVQEKPLWTTPWGTVSEEVAKTLREAIERAAQGEHVHWKSEMRVQVGGRETIAINASLRPVRDDIGNVVFLCAEASETRTSGSQVPPDSLGQPPHGQLGESQTHVRNVVLEEANVRLKDELDNRKENEIAQAKLAAIIESSDDAIVSKSLEGIIVSWNRGAEKILGYTSEETVGQHILLIVPPERHEEERSILARLRKGQKIDHFETQRLRKDGQRIDLSLSVSPIRDSTGTIVGASKIARDITDRKRIEEEREALLVAERKAREAAQRINTLKDEFLATLSHELRTPLNAVMGWAQLLSTGKLDSEEYLEAGRVIERNARIQKQLIDDLLDMSRIISGKLRLDLQRISPVDFIEAAIETVSTAAEAKGIRIEKLLDPLAGPIAGDPARLQQVAWNLLSNAVKFTPRGGRIQVLLERVNSHLELTVADSGQGIDPAFLPHLFERFRQADASTSRRYGGLGLGLSIVKQIAELHGGSVRAKSDGPGTGSTFILHLPILILHGPDEEEDRCHPRVSRATYDCQAVNLTGLNILVVDDEPDARELVKRLLLECGAVVTDVGSAAAALDSLAMETPDILISDIGMPVVDGYEFLRRLRKSIQAARIPAIALTAFARSEDRTRAMLAGYIAHVAKPVEPAELLATIAVVTGREAIG